MCVRHRRQSTTAATRVRSTKAVTAGTDSASRGGKPPVGSSTSEAVGREAETGRQGGRRPVESAAGERGAAGATTTGETPASTGDDAAEAAGREDEDEDEDGSRDRKP